MLNHVLVQGRLTADPEIRTTTEGTSYTRFSVATERPRRKGAEEKETDFFSCIAWGKTAEIICEWYHKGDMMIIAGVLRNHKWIKDDETRISTQIVVREVHFPGNKAKSAVDSSASVAVPQEIEGINDFDLTEFEEILSGEDMPF